MRTTERLQPDYSGIDRAAELLLCGELVAFPTETVYGLGGDATNGQAVAGIYQAKGRPSFNPLIAHVADVQQGMDLIALPEAGLKLAEAFWPGPLTLVAPKKPESEVSGLVTAGLETLAVRVPSADLPRALLRAVGRPVAAPSANLSGRISPTRAEHVLDGLDGRIAAVLDGGSCDVGLESTILGFAGEDVNVLRPGGLAIEQVEAVIGRPVTSHDEGRITAPGQLASHYAPRAPLRLNAQNAQPGEVFLSFGEGSTGAMSLSPEGELAEAAANLFDYLHLLDDIAQGRTIAVGPIPERGLGLAINDRLRRAAAPRS
ncbi:MAG: L-threonylcarbamoyladenylate synthase [Pseudomonadota bacterium]